MSSVTCLHPKVWRSRKIRRGKGRDEPEDLQAFSGKIEATVTLLLDSTDIALWLGVPLVIVHMMLPPIFAVASIRIYAQRNPERATRWLFIRTSLVAVGTSILGLAILLDSLGDIWRHFEMVAPR
eukprot:TRINITY_DN65083_c0_g2_i1.p1 TRINITY_DN65083_c0_g2~~TRINITY_DN65083_c0_g2_i1.p1  ORF type:complete len:125 (+),score=14.32 TRINITY_DN65083_c0_g2_i1:233-607(+)